MSEAASRRAADIVDQVIDAMNTVLIGDASADWNAVVKRKRAIAIGRVDTAIARAVAEERESLIRFFSLKLADSHTWTVREIVREIESRAAAPAKETTMTPTPDDGYLHTTLHGVKVKVLLDPPQPDRLRAINADYQARVQDELKGEE